MSSDSTGPDGPQPPYVGAMFRVVWQWVRVQLYAGVVEAGFDDLSAAHVALWRYPGLEGVRPSQLADRAGITKQSVNDLLGHLEGRGYLSRVPDSVDGRARVVRLSAKGRRLQGVIYDAAGAAQQQIEEILGPQRFAQLQSSLELLADQLEGSPGVPRAG
jgi:DNA-binding MarR family transcriptional regulator